ncbi:MAG: glutamine amidotransferase [Clostridiales bacterium]|nr:glutamine amidotransferase [Clostridiales bacterium]
MKLTIAHLYPELLNLYGDGGNLIAMKNRLNWRNIECEIVKIPLGHPFNAKHYDIVFIGGGQDFEQEVILKDLKGDKTKQIIDAINNDVTFLGICGGYQLLGNYYKTKDGQTYDFIGALDLYTIGQEKRMIGDFMFSSPYINNKLIVGFENHSGKTYLGDTVKPLGIVKKGYGNNGEDKTEGARFKNVFCSYSHGSLLPKNPLLCDYILQTTLQKKYNITLSDLDDTLENKAHDFIVNRF